MTFTTVNPANGEPLADYDLLDSSALERHVERVSRGWLRWRGVPFAERAECLRSAARLLRERTESLARLASLEMGKPIVEARAEVIKCAWVCEYYAEHAESMLRDEPAVTDASRSWVRYEPIGPILLIMPWNFPYWQVFRQIAPQLMVGNTCLLKHAPHVWGCADAIAALVRDAGFPDDVFATLRVDTPVVSGLIADSRIAGVALTGSERAGRAVAADAGRALKPCVLELGGSDPFAILHDADIELAVQGAVLGRFVNSGQSCISAKRIIVERSVADAFVASFVEAVPKLRIGDPLDETTQIGPIARADLRAELDRQVRGSVAAGARVRCGGVINDSPGYFYAPTVLDEVRPGMPAFDEELFGPVAAITIADSDEHVFELANQSRFGLGASIWTSANHPDQLVERIVAGTVMVNGVVKSDPRLPFGGVRASGLGRELGRHGIMSFVNVKSVWIR